MNKCNGSLFTTMINYTPGLDCRSEQEIIEGWVVLMLVSGFTIGFLFFTFF